MDRNTNQKNVLLIIISPRDQSGLEEEFVSIESDVGLFISVPMDARGKEVTQERERQ